MNSNPEILMVQKRLSDDDKTGRTLVHNGVNIIALLMSDIRTLDEKDRLVLKQSYRHYGRDWIYDLVKDNKIIPFAAYSLSSIECDKVFWDSIYSKFLKKNEAVREIVHSIFMELEHYDCKSLTLTENFAVVLSSQMPLGCFCSGDVDLSADIAEKDAISACLNSLGFHSKTQDEKIGEYTGQSLMFYNQDVIDGGFWINVVWVPVTRAFLEQEKYNIRLSQDRRAAKTLSASKIRILEDTSLMYFCALHIGSGHYFTLSPGIRLYVDIDRLARTGHIDWPKLLEWARIDSAGIRISMVLCICHKLFRTPIPERQFSAITRSKRNRILLNYLIKPDTLELQSNSSFLRRLLIEILSDDRWLLINVFVRPIKLIQRIIRTKY